MVMIRSQQRHRPTPLQGSLVGISVLLLGIAATLLWPTAVASAADRYRPGDRNLASIALISLSYMLWILSQLRAGNLWSDFRLQRLLWWLQALIQVILVSAPVAALLLIVFGAPWNLISGLDLLGFVGMMITFLIWLTDHLLVRSELAEQEPAQS
jgi:hypothetical protein